MRRLVTAALLTVLWAGLSFAQAPQVTAADAAPFLGDWVVTAEGQNGPATFNLSLKMEGDKVTGEISSDQQGAQKITDVTKREKSLLLGYSFDYQGMAVSTVVTLTPATEKDKLDVVFDFAGGAYVMNGVGAKKAAK